MIFPFETHVFQTSLTVLEIQKKLAEKIVTPSKSWRRPRMLPNWMSGKYEIEDDFVGWLSDGKFRIERFISLTYSRVIVEGQIDDKGNHRLITLKLQPNRLLLIPISFFIMWCLGPSYIMRNAVPFIFVFIMMLMLMCIIFIFPFILLPFSFQAKRYLRAIKISLAR